MRKLIVSMNLSLDGYLSGPRGELDWHFQIWNDDMAEKILEHLEKTDTIILGRRTYEAMAGYWTLKPISGQFPRQDLPIADKMNQYTKIVFSRTVTHSGWYNSIFSARDPREEIKILKKQKGKDMILYGSAELASALILSGIVDEYHLWIHPVILGKGRLLFKNLKTKMNLRLRESLVFESGVVANFYDQEQNIRFKL